MPQGTRALAGGQHHPKRMAERAETLARIDRAHPIETHPAPPGGVSLTGRAIEGVAPTQAGRAEDGPAPRPARLAGYQGQPILRGAPSVEVPSSWVGQARDDLADSKGDTRLDDDIVKPGPAVSEEGEFRGTASEPSAAPPRAADR